MSKKEVLVRLTTSDVVLSKADAENIQDYLKVLTKDDEYLTDVEVYCVGYEFEDGTECEEDGSPL